MRSLLPPFVHFWLDLTRCPTIELWLKGGNIPNSLSSSWELPRPPKILRWYFVFFQFHYFFPGLFALQHLCYFPRRNTYLSTSSSPKRPNQLASKQRQTQARIWTVNSQWNSETVKMKWLLLIFLPVAHNKMRVPQIRLPSRSPKLSYKILFVITKCYKITINMKPISANTSSTCRWVMTNLR